MKANAPEKIYLANTECRTLEGWHRKPFAINGVECIEYTRTGALIKKVCAYIENNIYDHYDGDNEYGICGGYVKKEEFIKNFKDYMKGE